MTNTNLTPETIVKVTNRSNGVVIYRIPERHIRREFNRKEMKKVPFQEILEVAAQPGGRELIYNFLYIENPEAIEEGLNIAAEPEYWLTEEKIPSWMQTCPIAEFKDALDFAPEGIKSLIKSYAVSLPLNDVAKREALRVQLNFDVDRAIANNAATEEDEAPVASTGRRSKPSYIEDKPATPNYKIVTPKTAE